MYSFLPPVRQLYVTYYPNNVRNGISIYTTLLPQHLNQSSRQIVGSATYGIYTDNRKVYTWDNSTFINTRVCSESIPGDHATYSYALFSDPGNQIITIIIQSFSDQIVYTIKN